MKKFFAVYDKAEEYLLVGSLVFTVCLIFLQVVMRYVFNSSLSWSEELARYIFIWQIWLGASVGIRMKQQIRVELITSRLGVTGKRAMDLLATSILLAFCVFLVVNGTDLTMKIASRHALSSALRIPLFSVYLALPFSAGVTALRLIEHISAILKSFRKAEGGNV